MIGILKHQRAAARRIPLYLDPIEVAHKTGDFPPCLPHDAGLAYLKSGPPVMVVLSDQIHGNYGEAEVRIGQLARQVADYVDTR